MKRTGSIGLYILAAGFLAGLAADIVLLVMGRSMALPFLCVLLVLGWVAYQVALKWIPPVIMEEPGEPEGEGVPGCAASGALAARDPGAPDCDRGAGWYNTLSAGVGSAAMAAPEDLLAAAAGKNLIVIPRHELTSLLSKSPDALEQLAKNAVVALDDPDDAALAALGFKGGADTETGTVTWVDSDVLPPDAAARLESCPLPVTVRKLDAIPGNYAVWMRMAYYPAVVARATENGALIISLFDFARLCTRLRQGGDAPDPVLSLTGSRPHHRVPHALRDNDTPWVDLLTSFFINLTRRFTPLPCWWPHPNGAPATLALSADDEGSGRVSVIKELFKDARVTIFSAADAPAPDVCERGLLWNRYALYTIRGGVRRNAKPALADQLAAMRDDSSVLMTRVRESRLDGGADAVFSLLERNNVAADGSFGPGPAHAGYAFATGFPFHHIAATGRPHAPLELPFQVHDLGGVPSQAWLDRLAGNAANIFNSVVTVALRPRRCLQSPAMRKAFKHLAQAAQENSFHITGAASYIAFWQGRARSPITCGLEENTLNITAKAETDNLALWLPKSLRGRKRNEVLVNGRKIDEVKNDLLPLSKGTHSVTIIFEK